MKEQVVCLRCGSIDDYEVVRSGPHLKAICNGCGKYIKFIKRSNKTNMDNQTQWGAPTQPAQQNNNRPLPGGVRFFEKHPNAPDFVLASLILSLDDLYAFAKNNPQYLVDYQGKKQLKLQVLRSKEGKIYSVVDTYGSPAQPAQQQQPAPVQNNWGQHAAQPVNNGWGAPPTQPAPQQQQQPMDDYLPF